MVDVTVSGLRKDVNGILKNGEPVRIRYFNILYGAGSDYDNEIRIEQSGTDFWTSGLAQPLNIESARASDDAVLLQQGKILKSDLKLYVGGAVNTSGLFKIGIGSANPPNREYAVNQGGVTTWDMQGEPVYKKIYLTYLTTGSLAEEQDC